LPERGREPLCGHGRGDRREWYCRRDRLVFGHAGTLGKDRASGSRELNGCSLDWDSRSRVVVESQNGNALTRTVGTLISR
jgi:hypothetical protein